MATNQNIYSEIGEIKGRLDTIERGFERRFDEVVARIDKLTGVPQVIFDERKKYVDERINKNSSEIKLLKDRVERLEDEQLVKNNSLTGKVGAFLEHEIVKIIGTGAIILLISVAYLNYQRQIENLQKEMGVIRKEKQNGKSN